MGKLILANNNNQAAFLSEAYLSVPGGNGVMMRKDVFLSEISQLPKEDGQQLFDMAFPEYLGLGLEDVGILITATGKVVKFVKGLFGNKSTDPTIAIPASTVIMGMGATGIGVMITKGNAVYFGGKVFLTEQGYNLLSSQTWPSATVKQQYLDAFPFSVPEGWKPALAKYEEVAAPAAPVTTPTTTVTTAPGGAALPGTTPTTRGGFNLQFQPTATPEKKWYENPVVMIGGGIVVLAGLYLMTRQRSNQRSN